MEHLLSAWPAVLRRVRDSRRILLLSDYDGTLSPIVERPEMALMPREIRVLLERLARHQGFEVGIISGRALNDLKERVGLEGITYAGNHGLEIQGPGVAFVNPLAEEMKPLLHLLHRVLNSTLTAIRGTLVENKGLSLSVHYRQVDESRTEDVRRAVDSVVAASRAVGKIRTTSGKKVYEVRPAVDWDKGKAIELLLERHSRKGKSAPLPIFLGDDATDEDGFKVVQRNGGISVLIGEKGASSGASYCLSSVAEVGRFLELLEECKRRPE